MATSTVQLAVCGLHLTGQPLNKQLTELGARLHGGPTKPGMVFVTNGTGNSIHLEIWEMPIEKLGSFVVKVPAPLAIGTVRLEHSKSCLGFVAEGYVAENNEDITHLGSWLEYLKRDSKV